MADVPYVPRYIKDVPCSLLAVLKSISQQLYSTLASIYLYILVYFSMLSQISVASSHEPPARLMVRNFNILMFLPNILLDFDKTYLP